MKKQNIINEIIRTSKENNGVPLGMGRFEKETGIKWVDWYGKFWAKWSDAIKEAGLKPNVLQEPYDESWLIEKLIEFIREIKKFPTDGELRLKAHSDKNFPSQSTYTNRFGKKQEIVRRIIEYCSNEKEFSDIIEICNSISKPAQSENKTESVSNSDNFEFVYLMKSGRFYKIGRSSSVEKRNYKIGIKLPERLETTHKIRTDDPVGIEAYWHKRFANKRKKGEWFELSTADVRAFKRRKFM